MQGAALRTRGGAGARLQAGARVCNVGSAWRAAVAGSSRWRRGCRPGWPAAPVRGARSHADSHLAAESATAGQSVRRIQAPTGQGEGKRERERERREGEGRERREREREKEERREREKGERGREKEERERERERRERERERENQGTH